jgi:CHAD domain-containing protein
MLHLDSQNSETAPDDRRQFEWLFEAPDLPAVERWLRHGPWSEGVEVVETAPRGLRDVCFDTQDWRFFRAGYMLILRRGAIPSSREAGAQWVLRSPAILLNLAYQVRECRESFEEGMPACDAPGPVGRIVRLLAGKRTLHPLVEVSTQRQTFRLERAGEALGELALDEMGIAQHQDQDPLQLRRVEIHEPDRQASRLEYFVEGVRSACDLVAATGSVYELGLRALHLSPPIVPDLGSTSVEARTPLGEAAFAVLRGHFGVWQVHEIGTRLGEDPEALHRMRVATRRLRAALGFFDDVLPRRRAAWLRDELAWIGTALGEVRDLDVQREHLAARLAEISPAEHVALEPVDAVLVGGREVAREEMLRALDSKRFQRFVAVFSSMLETGARRLVGAARETVVASVPSRLVERRRAMRKAGDRLGKKSSAAELHALRIHCKHLRYAVESFAGVYGETAVEYARRLSVLQDVLGRRQDAAVARTQLEELSASMQLDLESETFLAIENLAESYQQQAAAARGQFREAYRRTRGKSWKKLRRVMKELRSPEEPPPLELKPKLPAPRLELGTNGSGKRDARSNGVEASLETRAD